MTRLEDSVDVGDRDTGLGLSRIWRFIKVIDNLLSAIENLELLKIQFYSHPFFQSLLEPRE